MEKYDDDTIDAIKFILFNVVGVPECPCSFTGSTFQREFCDTCDWEPSSELAFKCWVVYVSELRKRNDI